MENNYKVIEYSSENKSEWDEFVDSSSNGTIFHKQAFLEYHHPAKFQFNHLMIYKNKNLISVIPGAIVGEMFKSPMGASFGGFVIPSNLGIEDGNNIVKSFIKYCAKKRIKEVYITPPMQIYYESFNEVMEYSMHYNHFVTISSLYSSVIDFLKIHGKEDLSQNTRHKINKSINKGVKIVEKNDFDAFYPILIANKKKFGVSPTHTLEDLKKIDKLLPGKIKLFMAYYNDIPIAGELLFLANKTCVLNFYTMHLYEYRNMFPVNYLIEYATRWCNDNGYRYYDYGVSADTFSSDPMEPSWSLIEFKESMRANGCMRNTYYRRIF